VAGPGVPQIKDFNPGVAPSGLFWTIRIPDDAVAVDAKATNARYDVKDVSVFEYTDVWAALAGEPGAPAVVSFNSSWRATGKSLKVRDASNRFTGVYRMAQSTIEWKAKSSNFAYQSDAANTSTTVFSAIGRERNGIFFT